MRELSVAVIGVGHMGAFHVETLERMRETRLVAIAEPNELMARERIGRRPVEWFADYRAILARPDVDAVCICSPSSSHAQIGLESIAAGKHVFVEKPIATRLEDALEMAGAARAAGVKLMVGHIERFNPAVSKLADLIAEGQIGRVFHVHATRVGPLPSRVLDSGVTLDLATHDLDIMQFVLSQPISSLYAERCRFQHPSDEDLISCLLRFGEDGPVGLLEVNWLTPQKRRELTVIGERGMLGTSYLTQDLWFTESAGAPTDWGELARVRGNTEGTAVRFSLRRVEPLRAELEAFARCVLDDTPEPVSAHEGCRALAAALAVLDSADTARRVDLVDLPEPSVRVGHDRPDALPEAGVA
jgi:UDP-N-acetylglucosamine 3-dehydrogenase